MNPFLQQLIDMIKNLSPLLWGILIKQVYSDAVANLFWIVGLIIISIICFKLGKYFQKKKSEDQYDTNMLEVPMFIFYLISGVLIFPSIGLFVETIQKFYNPQFYAIQYLINQIPH